ncbi:MAG: phosphotransferase [bacterium]|nr:phosphotransferase [bacterium]
MEKTVKEFSLKEFSFKGEPRIVKLHGDASNRTYYRVHLGETKTFIVMQLPPGKSSVSEEITNYQGGLPEIPFLNIVRFLAQGGIPVPKIYREFPEKKLILLEDLGNETIEKRFERKPEEKEFWYKKAIDLLIQLQQKTTTLGFDCVALQRSFDQTLLNWELDHFREYGIEARLDKQITDEDKKSFEKWSRLISQTMLQAPYVLTHRDYQSRNLMIRNESLVLIDFQDALLGPVAYDLVALLRDSYCDLSPALLKKLIGYFVEKRNEQFKFSLNLQAFEKLFDWVTIQRKLKDAGRFVFIDRVKKNSSFLPFIPRSLQHVKEAFERQEELKDFFELLKKYVPEFS